jgi:hypothetical protein
MYQIGKKIDDEGVWRSYQGARLLIGRAGSNDFLKAQETLERPHRKKLDKGTLSSTIKRDLNIRAIARAILLDWDGVGDGDKLIAYTEELGYTQLGNDPDMLEFIIDISIDNANYEIKQVEKIAKKSSPQSSGSKLTGTK